MEKYNDNELLYLVQENDDFAKEILIGKYKPLIINKIEKLHLEKDEIEEFYQEGLICLVKAINSYDEKYYFSFNGYFQLILKRKFIDLLKLKKKKDKIVYINNLDEYVIEKRYENDLNTINEEDLELSNFEKQVYLLRFITCLKPKDIAINLDANIKQVYDALDRIRKKARKKY